jgi:protein-S-isoprenylcysteine O-methyltransferase Ste14
MMRRTLYFIYGAACYLVFFVTFLYAAGFVGGLVVPTTLDGPARGPLGEALAVDLGLLALFAVQHSVMARRGFKAWWTRFVPKPIERSTFTLMASLALQLMFWQWRPMGGVVWDVHDPALRAVLYALFGFGWTLVLVATFLIHHFDLFGLRQVWLHLLGREYRPLPFGTPGFYRMVRHPLYLGFLFGFWMTPTMTIAHLVFAVMTTAYILVAIQLEERDLVHEHGEKYLEYRARTPMLVPFTKWMGSGRAAKVDWRKVGTAGFAFFLVKGLLWLVAPAVLWLLG